MQFYVKRHDGTLHNKITNFYLLPYTHTILYTELCLVVHIFRNSHKEQQNRERGVRN